MAAAASSTTEGAGTLAQQLLRKRYVGITGSNKVVGALEVQQVSPALHTASRSLKGLHVTVMPVTDGWSRDIANITCHRGCNAGWYMPVPVIFSTSALQCTKRLWLIRFVIHFLIKGLRSQQHANEERSLYLQIMESQVCQSTRFNKLAPVCGTVQGEPFCIHRLTYVYINAMRRRLVYEIMQMHRCNLPAATCCTFILTDDQDRSCT